MPPLMRRASIEGLAAVAAFAWMLGADARSAQPTAAVVAIAPDLPHTELEIRTANGRTIFHTAVADTEERQERGLMFVRMLPADEAMLFPESPPRVMAMWMKNTLIPLDMLFIDEHGRIACVRERAPPESLDIIRCEEPVAAVLEIGGGLAAKFGIRVGDRARWPPAGR